jgi:hypothetical protein
VHLENPSTAIRAAARSAVFLVKMMPVLQGPIDWVTERPVVEKLAFRTEAGQMEADLYRPRSKGPHPGVLVSLGVLPMGVVDPRAAQIGEALARSGFAALLYWSPSAGDLRLIPEDIPVLVSAYEDFIRQPVVDAKRSGLMGICVGASFALIAAASPRIRDQVRFVFAYAPYSSLWTLALDIASGTRTVGTVHEAWDVDPLTWKVYVRSVTDRLEPAEARRLRDALEDRISWDTTRTVIVHAPMRGEVDQDLLSADGRAILRLLAAGADDVATALRELPASAASLLTAMSPMTYVDDITAPRIMLLHDRYDHMIPVGESRRLWSALSPRPGASYREMGLRHLRMPGGLSPLRLVREIGKSYLAWYPLFRAAVS